ncbi:MAG TPA: hypothetical protein VMG10_17265 [Gemmataceae bacterium]|nr:hypothetical protein [Gemmataceae bacterium]
MAAHPNDPNSVRDIAIFERLLSHGAKELSPDLARYFLALRFSPEDQARMHDLAAKNQEGLLSAEDQEELLAYARAGCLLGIFQSRARQILKKPVNKVS